MRELKQEIINQEQKRLEERLLKCETEEGLKHLMSVERKKYKGNVKEKFIKFLKKKSEKFISYQLEKIKLIEEADHTNFEPLVITVEWNKSRTWARNPKSYTNYGFESRAISGCGYDKLSTATAEALNSYLPLLKLLYLAKDKAIREHKGEMVKEARWDGDKKVYVDVEIDTKNGINRKYLGYGSGYGVLPSFEGAVGVSSHRSIIEGLGLKWEQVISTEYTDVFMVSLR